MNLLKSRKAARRVRISILPERLQYEIIANETPVRKKGKKIGKTYRKEEKKSHIEIEAPGKKREKR